MGKKFVDLANLKSNLENFLSEIISPTFATKEGVSKQLGNHTVKSDVPENAVFTDTKDWESITGKPDSFPPSSHGHTVNEITGLQDTLDGKASSDHTHDDRYYTESEINTKLNSKLNTSLKGSANGLAELDANGKVPSSQLPSFVDDIIEGYLSGGKFYKESAHTTEITGETGKIYIDLATNKTYRWSGSAFVVVSETLALGETSSTAYRGDRGKIAYDHSQSTHARTDATKVEKSSTNGNIKINGTETIVYTHPSGTNPHGTTKSDVGLGNVGNFKAVSTVANQGLTEAEKSNARANIGAQVAGSYASSNHNHDDKYQAKGSYASASHTHDDRYYTESEINTKLNGKANSSHTHGNGDITSLDASKITSGTISIDRLPQGALERLTIVADDTARFKLTSATIQKGDTVKVTSTGKMYYVVDETKLSSEAGYEVYAAGTAASVPWSGVTGKPSTYTPSSHTHDDRYYTESEVDSKLGGKVDLSRDGINKAINKLDVGTSIPTDADYYLSQYVGGGTTTTTYHRRPMSALWNYIKGKADKVYSVLGHKHTKAEITDFPTSMPASDVYTWAKASSKPSYTKSEVGLGNVDNTADSAKSVKYATSAGSASSASKATGLVDYGATTKTIQIGYSGDGISGDAIKYIAGYTTGNDSDVNAKIKDVSKDALKSWLGLRSAAYTNSLDYARMNHTHTELMSKDNPTGTGSFSLNRKKGTTVGSHSHAEGYNTTASEVCSHAEGFNTTASEVYSHAEGYNTTASSQGSHAEGYETKASGYSSHAEGYNTTASNQGSHACGKFNVAMTAGGTGSNTTGTAFVIGNGTWSDKLSNAFSVQYDGTVKAKSTITASTTADYAEFFEWIDKNPDEEDRVGHFVTLDGDKIKIATSEDDYILGIVSGEPFVLGNGDCDTWNGMFLHDEFRRTMYEPAPKIIETLDNDGNPTGEYEEVEGEYEGTRPILNPDYDPTQKYISRFDRAEWSPVGMLGVLAVLHDGTAEVNGYVTVNNEGIATKCTRDTRNSYRVIKKVSDKVVEVIFR